MPPSTPSKIGRPKTGKTRITASFTLPPALMAQARKIANRKGESLSQYVSRAIQNAVLSEP